MPATKHRHHIPYILRHRAGGYRPEAAARADVNTKAESIALGYPRVQVRQYTSDKYGSTHENVRPTKYPNTVTRTTSCNTMTCDRTWKVCPEIDSTAAIALRSVGVGGKES